MCIRDRLMIATCPPALLARQLLAVPQASLHLRAASGLGVAFFMGEPTPPGWLYRSSEARQFTLGWRSVEVSPASTPVTSRRGYLTATSPVPSLRSRSMHSPAAPLAHVEPITPSSRSRGSLSNRGESGSPQTLAPPPSCSHRPRRTSSPPPYRGKYDRFLARPNALENAAVLARR